VQAGCWEKTVWCVHHVSPKPFNTLFFPSLCVVFFGQGRLVTYRDPCWTSSSAVGSEHSRIPGLLTCQASKKGRSGRERLTRWIARPRSRKTKAAIEMKPNPSKTGLRESIDLVQLQNDSLSPEERRRKQAFEGHSRLWGKRGRRKVYFAFLTTFFRYKIKLGVIFGDKCRHRFFFIHSVLLSM